MSGRQVVLGGGGFIGSHLCDRLLDRGDQVVCVDDFSTGRRSNVAHLHGHPGFTLVEADVSVGLPVEGPVTGVFHTLSAGNTGQCVPGTVVPASAWVTRVEVSFSCLVVATAAGTAVPPTITRATPRANQARVR